MKKPLHFIFYFFVLTLTLLSQVSATVTFDDSAVVIEEMSDGWILSGDINDDGDDRLRRASSVRANNHYTIVDSFYYQLAFSHLSLRPETRAPPQV